jgi:hypothetical protein
MGIIIQIFVPAVLPLVPTISPWSGQLFPSCFGPLSYLSYPFLYICGLYAHARPWKRVATLILCANVNSVRRTATTIYNGKLTMATEEMDELSRPEGFTPSRCDSRWIIYLLRATAWTALRCFVCLAAMVFSKASILPFNRAFSALRASISTCCS